MFSAPRAHASETNTASEAADRDDEEDASGATAEKQAEQAAPPPAELGLGPDVISLATVPYTDLLASGMQAGSCSLPHFTPSAIKLVTPNLTLLLQLF